MALYDQSKVTVVVDGTYITGFGEGTKVSAERNEDNIVPYVFTFYSSSIKGHLRASTRWLFMSTFTFYSSSIKGLRQLRKS